MHSSLWLSALIALPLLGALVVVTKRDSASFARRVGVATAFVELVLAGIVAGLYRGVSLGASTSSAFDFVTRRPVARAFGLYYDLGVDGVSLFMLVLTALVVLVAFVGALEKERSASFVGWLLVLTSAIMGSFATRDALTFFLFFELTLIPSYFLIAGWGGAGRTAAALKFFVYTFFGSGFLFVGLLFLGIRHQHVVGGALTFSLDALSVTPLASSTATLIVVGFLVAFGIKSPLFPFHTWSPATYAEAPTAGSMVLSALLAKLGTYGLLRFVVVLFAHDASALAHVRPYVLTLAVIGIVYGSALAARSRDLKRLVAYSSLAQVGFIILGIFSGSAIALNGAVLLMFNHGVITAALFLLIGYLERRRGTSVIADLRGLQGPAPVLAALFTIVMLASIGLPGLSGFVSEFLVLLGSFGTHPWWAAVATTGVVFAALYLLWAYQRVFHGDAQGDNATIADATTSERLTLLPLLVLIVVLGVFPKPFLHQTSNTTSDIVLHSNPSGVSR